MASGAGLGMQLRRLLDALDGDVEAAYREAGLEFRPRYTPVMQHLFKGGPVRIRDLSDRTGLSHSALSQTVAQMQKTGWVRLEAGADRREKRVHPTAKALAAEPVLRRKWAATAAAAASLSEELGCDLSAVFESALQALEREPFRARIARAAK